MEVRRTRVTKLISWLMGIALALWILTMALVIVAYFILLDKLESYHNSLT